jgi:hypothetical protein
MNHPIAFNHKRLRFFGQVASNTSWVRTDNGRSGGGVDDTYTSASLWYDRHVLLTLLTTRSVAQVP